MYNSSMTFTTITSVYIGKVVTLDILDCHVVPQGYKYNKNVLT